MKKQTQKSFIYAAKQNHDNSYFLIEGKIYLLLTCAQTAQDCVLTWKRKHKNHCFSWEEFIITNTLHKSSHAQLTVTY